MNIKLSCKNCGEDHPACLDFHHRNKGDKDVNIGNVALINGWCIKRIESEIAKCDVLCSNCHRKHHYNERRKLKRPHRCDVV